MTGQTYCIPQTGSLPEAFRHKFQSSLRACVRRHFTVEEAFGLVWLETLEEVQLPDMEQSRMYEEMIGWARELVLK